MQIRRCTTWLCLFVALSSTLSAEALNELRTWTSQDGNSLRATLLNSDASAQTARMRRDDGRIFTIAWSRLCTADQTLLREQNAAATPAAKGEPAAKPTEALPSAFKLKRVPMVTQKENYCVPASATMIAGFHGIETDQDQVAQLSSEGSASSQGTYPSDMSLAMGKLGFDGRTLLWKGEADFNDKALPEIRHTLVNSGPIYISFRAGVFGDMGHGCVIIGYDDRREEMLFHNPWGNEFKKDYSEVAVQGYGVVFLDPPQAAPIASDAFIAAIQQNVPRFDGDFLTLTNRLIRAGQSVELVWCSRRDARDDKRFAVNTARHDGRKILNLAFRRNPAVLIPASPDGQTKKYYFVTRPPEGGASYMVREITEQGWSDETLKTLGSLTREWATVFNTPDQPQPVWELPMIELHEAR